MICIPKSESEKLKKAIRNGDFSIETLYKMTSQERHELLSHYVGESFGTLVNGTFEKAMVSRQKDSLKKWVAETFGGKKEKQKDAIDKINSLESILTPENGEDFMRDLAATKLGFSVTAEQARNIVNKAKKIGEFSEQKDELGLPSQEYLEAYNDMEKYVQSLNPTNKLRIMTSLFGRAMMLFRPSSIALNIESNVLNTLLTEVEKRIGSLVSDGVMSGANKDLVSEFVKKNATTYAKTGYDFSRMNQLSEGHKILNEDVIHTEGGGFIRKVLGKGAERFLQLSQGLPDVVFASRQFATTANIMSTAMAKDEGLTGDKMKERAREIMLDSFKMEPLTEAGQKVREEAQADAEHATYTENSFAARNVSLKIRKVFNDLIPNLRLGDLNIPFAKTPANVASQGVKNAGGGIFEIAYQGYQLKKAWQDFGKGSPEAKKSISRIVRTATRMGLGLIIARLIVANIDDDDFIGSYPTSQSEQKLFEARNGIENSIKIGDHWVSTAYFGPLAPAITGMLYAKKYKKQGTLASIFGYIQGAGQGLLELPGISQAKDAVTYFTDVFKQGKTVAQIKDDAINGLIDFARARSIPGVVNDIAKATDEYERKTDATAISKAQSTIPGLREKLPEKRSVFGKKIETESALSIFLFGSRKKTANDSPVIKEMIRLQRNGSLPSLTDVEKSSKRVQDFKKQVSKQTYKRGVVEFKKEFGSQVADLISSDKYKEMDDEAKQGAINGLKDKLLVSTLTSYGYTKPVKKKK